MCTCFFALEVHPEYPFILLFNRDEFYARPTLAAHHWSSGIQAGKDLVHGGTWLGIASKQRFACVTNVRNPSMHRVEALSRGVWVPRFLESGLDPQQFFEKNQSEFSSSNEFNLLFGELPRLCFLHWGSEKGMQFHPLEAGIYGFSNASLDTPWPKVAHGKREFAGLVMREDVQDADLWQLMQTEEVYPDESLPQTGVGIDWERRLSSIFIRSENYGTRSTTLVKMNRKKEFSFQEVIHR